jgi:hypothetical protein
VDVVQNRALNLHVRNPSNAMLEQIDDVAAYIHENAASSDCARQPPVLSREGRQPKVLYFTGPRCISAPQTANRLCRLRKSLSKRDGNLAEFERGQLISFLNAQAKRLLDQNRDTRRRSLDHKPLMKIYRRRDVNRFYTATLEKVVGIIKIGERRQCLWRRRVFVRNGDGIEHLEGWQRHANCDSAANYSDLES